MKASSVANLSERIFGLAMDKRVIRLTERRVPEFLEFILRNDNSEM